MINDDYKGYIHDKVRKELSSGYTHHAEATSDSLKFKKQEKPQKTITKKLKLISRKKQQQELDQKS